REAEVHAGVAACRAEYSGLALDHQRRHLASVGREQDVDVRPAPRLAGVEPDVEREDRDAIDDVLRSGVLEIVDSDAYPPLPACVASRTRRRRDLLQELRDVVAQVELDLAEPTAPHDDLLVDVLRRGL